MFRIGEMDWKRTSAAYTAYLLTKNCGPGTVRVYVNNLKRFWEWCEQFEATAWDADKPLIRTYLGERLSAGISAERTHNDLAALKSFFKWAGEDNLRADNPTDGLNIKRGKKLPTKPFLGDEVSHLIDACHSERDKLILLVMISTGMRVAEVSSLTSENIDWEQGEIIFSGKGSVERRVAPRPEVLGRLRSFLGMFYEGPLWIARGGKQLSYNQIRQIVYAAAKNAGIDSVHPHRFRASFATWFLDENPGDIQALQSILGHRSIETTARYTEYTKEKRALDKMRHMKNGLERLIS